VCLVGVSLHTSLIPRHFFERLGVRLLTHLHFMGAIVWGFQSLPLLKVSNELTSFNTLYKKYIDILNTYTQILIVS